MDTLTKLKADLEDLNRLSVLNGDVNSVTPDMGERFLISEEDQKTLDAALSLVDDIINKPERKVNAPEVHS